MPKIETPSKSNYTYEIVVGDIDIPWGMDFMNENELLVTEKSGTLYRVKNGVKETVEGLPDVYVRGQGGLLDVALHPDYQKMGLAKSMMDYAENYATKNNYVSIVKAAGLNPVCLLYTSDAADE